MDTPKVPEPERSDADGRAAGRADEVEAAAGQAADGAGGHLHAQAQDVKKGARITGADRSKLPS